MISFVSDIMFEYKMVESIQKDKRDECFEQTLRYLSKSSQFFGDATSIQKV